MITCPAYYKLLLTSTIERYRDPSTVLLTRETPFVSLLQPFKVWPSINNGSVSEPRTLHVFCNDVSVGSLAALDATKMRRILSNRWKNTIRHGVEI